MKPILFVDFGGTLCHEKFWRSLEADDFEKIQKFLFVDNKQLVSGWMKGAYTSEEINHIVSEKCQINYETLWSVFVSDCQNVTISTKSLEEIKLLGERYTTILLTDNMDCFLRFTVPAKALHLYFNKIITSLETRQFKEENEGEIFMRIAEGEGVSLDECILLEDSEKVCELFSKLGGQACLVTGEKPLGYWLVELLQKFH